jgi:N-acyl amino acid synthase FeeM
MLLSLARYSVHASYQAHANVSPRQAQYFARLALVAQTRRDAYRLRYDSYLTSGFIEPNDTGQFQDVYDDLPNCQTIVIYDQGEPVASVRTCTLAFGSRQRSPAMDTYPEQVTALLSQHAGIGFGGRGIETTRLVRSPAAENNQGLVFLLYRLAGYIGMMAYSQVLFACVRQNHVPFYRRLGYEPVTEPKPYPGLKCPMLLMACTRQRYDEIRSVFPLIDPYASETEALDGFLLGEIIPVSLFRSWD